MASRKVPKPKLLLDEGFPPRSTYKQSNQYCDIKHISHDFKLGGADDDQVYDFACSQKRILATFNTKHFRSKLSDESVTIVGVSMKITADELDKKLLKLLRNLKPTDALGKFFTIP